MKTSSTDSANVYLQGIVLSHHLRLSLSFNPHGGPVKYQDIVTLVGLPAAALHYKLQLQPLYDNKEVGDLMVPCNRQ